MFIKILNEREWHVGQKYGDGLCTCTDFEDNQKRSNGIHFTTLEHLEMWRFMGTHYREVLWCTRMHDFGCGTEFKAESVFLGPKRDFKK